MQGAAGDFIGGAGDFFCAAGNLLGGGSAEMI